MFAVRNDPRVSKQSVTGKQLASRLASVTASTLTSILISTRTARKSRELLKQPILSSLDLKRRNNQFFLHFSPNKTDQ